MPCTKWKRVHPVSTSEEVLFASRDSKCMDKHFPSDIDRTPELLVGNAKCTGVPLKAIDSRSVCEKNMHSDERCEFGRELLQLSAHALTRGVLSVEGRKCWLRQQGCKEMVDELGVEEGRKLGEDLGCRNAEEQRGSK